MDWWKVVWVGASDVGWCDVVQVVARWFEVRGGMGWCGVVRAGASWYRLVRCGVDWCEVVRVGVR